VSLQSNRNEPDVDENADRVAQLEAELTDVQDTIADLEETVKKQQHIIDAYDTRFEAIKEILAGSPDTYNGWELNQFQSFYDRIVTLEDTVSDHEDRLELTLTANGSAGSPDERAMRLREVLYNKVKRKAQQTDHGDLESATVAMTRDSCTAALAGDLHRGSVLDAMKRAADGKLAGAPDAVEYTAINGASDVQPVDGITYESGRSVGQRGGSSQSRLVMAADGLTRVDVRQNLTTVNNGAEGER